MHRPNTMARVVTLAALAAFAAIAPGIAGQAGVKVTHTNPYQEFKRKSAERMVRTGGRALDYYGRKTNGGQRRKRAMLAKGVSRARI